MVNEFQTHKAAMFVVRISISSLQICQLPLKTTDFLQTLETDFPFLFHLLHC